MLNPAKDDEWYDAAKGEGVHGRAAGPGGRPAGAQGRRRRQHPGAPGIGDKGARDLIERFGSVEAALERAAEVERKMYRESLQNNVERIRMSKRLATIATDVPIEFALEAVTAQPPDPALLKAIYKELEFHSLLKELGPAEDTRAPRLPRDFERRRAGGVAGGRPAERAGGGGDLEIRRRRVRAGHGRARLARPAKRAR